MLYDYPDTAKFLTEDEREFIVARLKLDNDGCSQAFKYKFVKDAFLDWKVWVVSRRGRRDLYDVSLMSDETSVRNHVPGRLDARLRICPVLAYLDRQLGLHCRQGSARESNESGSVQR